MAHAPTFVVDRIKIIAAFIVAPLVPAILDGLYLIYTEGDITHPDKRAVAWFLVGAYPTVLFLGVPCYGLFKKVLAPSALNCSLFGALVAGIPWTLLFVGDWHGVLYFSRFTFLPGTLGGFIFWAIATSGQKAPWY